MLTDLMAGRLEASAVGAAAIIPFIKAGKVRCIATGSAQRLPQLPDVPTVAEQGFPGFEMTQWYGLIAPANLAPDHLAKLSSETRPSRRRTPWPDCMPTLPNPSVTRRISLRNSLLRSRSGGKK